MIFTIQTSGPGLYEFTADVAAWLGGQGDGLLTLFVRHTSCSLLVQENADPDVQRDLQAFFRRLVPPADDPAMDYLVHRAEGPDDMPAHIRSIMSGADLTIPVAGGACDLGTWQGVYLWEHRTSGHRRRMTITIYGERR